jgi:HlyD family secretion protein
VIRGLGGAPRLTELDARRAVRSRKPRRRLLWARLGVAAAAAGVLAGALLIEARTRPAPIERPMAETGVIPAVVHATARLEPFGTARVGSVDGGQVIDVRAAVGDRVKRGQILARLDDLEQRERVGVESAKLDIVTVEGVRSERRLDELLDAAPFDLSFPDSGDLLPGALGDAQADALLALKQVEKQEHTLAAARTVLGRRLIRAPMDGVVLERGVERGETVAPSPPGPPLFVLGSDPAVLRLRVSVDEAHGARLRPGDVLVHVPAVGAHVFTGSIRGAEPDPSALASPAPWAVTIEVPNPGARLRPGMSATVDFPREEPVPATISAR